MEYFNYFKNKHMKKIIKAPMLIIIAILLTSCSENLSDEEVVEMWDTNVSLVSDFNIELIQNKNITEDEVFKEIQNGIKEINETTTTLKKANGNKEQIKKLININDIIILTYNYSEKLIKGEEPNYNEINSSYNLGAETKSFADEYNKGVLPKSFIKLISFFDNNNSTIDSTNENETTISSNSVSVVESDSENLIIESTNSTTLEDTSDITQLSKKPTDKQKEILLTLTDQEFKMQYPYKGSKMHSILGVLQDWTEDDGKWYYKVEATIVNAYNAKQKVNLEVYITPENADSGYVEFITY